MNRNKRRSANRAFYCAAGLALALIRPDVVQATRNQAAANPVWPDNGIAQRKFPGGFNMFVENDHGKWHAWVMSDHSADARALDFFSGETMPVKADLLDNGDQDRSFTDAKGGFHIGEDKGFDFQWRGGLASGVDLAAETLSLKGTDYQCFTGLGGVSGGGKDNSGHSKWTKIPIYHINPRPGACPSGSYASGIDSALDLDDGTFLVTMGCWVFRLRKSDLSPMGSAPGLRVVDATDVQATIDRAKGKNIQDAASYLAKALHLDFDVANSCGAEAAH